jgi:hypothetical protein
MKSIIASATLVAVCICLLVGFTATRLHAGEYFIYQDSNGVLVISKTAATQQDHQATNTSR